MKIFELIDELKEELSSSPKSAFSNKRSVDLEIVTEILEDLKTVLPEELEQAAKLMEDKEKILSEASIVGDRKTLKADAYIPAAMAAIYLLLLLYFKMTGGYKPVSISPEKAAGGTAGPSGF